MKITTLNSKTKCLLSLRNNNTKIHEINMMKFNDCQLDHRSSLTIAFHHDRGRIVFAVSPRRGEQGASYVASRKFQPLMSCQVIISGKGEVWQPEGGVEFKTPA